MHEIIFEYLNIFEISLSYLWAMKGVRHFASILIWKKKNWKIKILLENSKESTFLHSNISIMAPM
jgi:hypothetical protein